MRLSLAAMYDPNVPSDEPRVLLGGQQFLELINLQDLPVFSKSLSAPMISPQIFTPEVHRTSMSARRADMIGCGRGMTTGPLPAIPWESMVESTNENQECEMKWNDVETQDQPRVSRHRQTNHQDTQPKCGRSHVHLITKIFAYRSPHHSAFSLSPGTMYY